MTNSSDAQHFLVLLRPARAGFPADATEPEIAKVGEHFEYLQELARAGVVRLAGRTDEAFPLGIIVLRARDRAEAEGLLAKDAALSAGIMKAELKDFRLAIVAAGE
jgi:hypothetical protein